MSCCRATKGQSKSSRPAEKSGRVQCNTVACSWRTIEFNLLFYVCCWYILPMLICFSQARFHLSWIIVFSVWQVDRLLHRNAAQIRHVTHPRQRGMSSHRCDILSRQRAIIDNDVSHAIRNETAVSNQLPMQELQQVNYEATLRKSSLHQGLAPRRTLHGRKR